MPTVDIEISNVSDVSRRLYAFSSKLGDRITYMALRSGAKLILAEARSRVPVKTGRLKKALTVKNSRINRRRRNGKVGIYLSINPGRSRDDNRGAYYGKFVDLGYKRGSKQITGAQAVARGIISREQLTAKRLSTARYQGIRFRDGGVQVDGQNFISGAFDNAKDAALELIVRNVEIAGEQLIDRI
jgi:hypothetical protein